MEQEGAIRVLVDLRKERLEEIAAARKAIKEIDAVLSMIESEPDTPYNRPTRRQSETLQEQVLKGSYVILEESGPMKRKVLLGKLIESGVRLGSTNPGKQLGKILALDSRFQTNGRGVWSLVGPKPYSFPTVMPDLGLDVFGARVRG